MDRKVLFGRAKKKNTPLKTILSTNIPLRRKKYQRNRVGEKKDQSIGGRQKERDEEYELVCFKT